MTIVVDERPLASQPSAPHLPGARAWSRDEASATLRASPLFGVANDAEIEKFAAACRIDRLHCLVLEQVPLTPFQIEAFCRNGELVEEPLLAPIDDPVLCQCMRVRRSVLTDAMAGGCQTVHALSVRTGAGTVCGGCLPRLADFTGEALWQTVRCVEVLDRAPRVKSFRFEIPEGHRAGTVRPGQHLVVQASIRGVDVQRSYTLTSPAAQQDHYEITVQREPHGVMSNWLFENMRPGAMLSILPPSGTCFFELRQSRPLVCLVGGIGVTPALGICRSAAASGAKRRIHVDYSVSTRDQIVCGDELHRVASSHASITVRTRITGEEGRFRAEGFAELVREFPHADWLICGSPLFQSDAQRLLLDLGIAARYIHVESFEPVGGTIPAALAPTAVLTPPQRRWLGYGLLVSIAVFVTQAQLGIKWPLLDRLQATTEYSALTGSALLVLLLLQWHLGYVRWRNRAGQASRAYGRHIALGPAVLGMMWLHSTHLGYALSFAVSTSFLISLATGAVLGAHPRSSHWQGARRLVLAVHIVLSCAGQALALTHGFTALWY
jgi:ferredoxin-NADP reductase